MDNRMQPPPTRLTPHGSGQRMAIVIGAALHSTSRVTNRYLQADNGGSSF